MKKLIRFELAVCILLLFLVHTLNAQQSMLHEMSKAAGLAESSRVNEAEKLLTPILRDNPNWGEGWIYLGRSITAQGKYAEGAKAVEKGGDLGEKRVTVWLEACSMALKNGDEPLALHYFEKALKGNVHRQWIIQPSSFDGYLHLGDFLEQPPAQKLLLKAADKRPALHPELISIERIFYANDNGQLQPEEIDSLLQRYRTVVKTLPKNGELSYFLGKHFVINSFYKEALPAFLTAKELGFQSAGIMDGWLAHTYAYLGNHDEAFKHLESNLATNDTPDWIFYPEEFDPLYKDPRWKKIVDKYRPTNTTLVQIPAKSQGPVPYPTKKWSRISPEKVGVNEKILLDAAQAIETSFSTVTSLLVVKNGQLVFERYFHGYTEKDAFNLKSATKSVTSTLAGMMHDQGILPTLNTPIVEIIPEYFEGIDEPLKRLITLEDLLTMRSGLDWVEGTTKSEELFLTGNYAQLLLKEKQVHPPGEVFEYSSAVTHLLAVTLAKASGQDLLSFAQKHLFEPLGIAPEFWVQDHQGNYLGDGELRLRPQDFAKFGLLILRGGEWESKSIVSTDWIRRATAIHVPEARGPHTSYGFQFWILNVGGHRVIKASGYGGQRCWIIPALDLVCVITSETVYPEVAPDAFIGQWIIPAVEKSNDK